MKTFIVDSFTDKPFAGNPAGVCFTDGHTDDDRMLQIAQELGLSETAFVTIAEGSSTVSIRFFSPKMEIPLCGHATMASARVIFQEQQDLKQISFINTQDLVLVASRRRNEIEMAFPVYETVPAEAPQALLDALQITQTKCVVHNEETNILMIEIGSTQALAAIEPDYADLIRSHDAINGVLVTAQSHADDFDFHSRYFWPWSGTNEDPVTGGTHTFLAKYWGGKLNKRKMRSFQSSKRSGFMQVELHRDQLLITGQACIIFRGSLTI